MIRIKKILPIVFLLCFFQTGAQTWWEKHKPHVPIWEYPRVKEMNLLDREYSRSIHFGFGLGLNAFDFSRIQNSNNTVFIPGQGNAILHADLIHLKPGFSINAVTDYRLMTNFNVRFLPGIFFGQRQLDFYRNDTKGLVKSMTIASNYLEFPIVFKYSADRYTNFRPYILTGLNTRVNLSNTINMDSERYIGLKKFEPFVEFGLGFDYYFDYFRMGTEFKVSSGLVNCLNNTEAFGYEYYRKSLKSIYSNTISFTISFEL